MKFFTTLCFCLYFLSSFSQEKNFSGEIVFQNTVKSYITSVSSNDFKNYLTTSDLGVIYTNSNYSIVKNEFFTSYINLKQKSSLTKFSNIDTLFTQFSGLVQTDSEIIKKNIKLDYDEILSMKTINVETLDTLYLGYKCFKVFVRGYDYSFTKIILDSNIYSNGSSVILFLKDSNCFYSNEAAAIKIIEKEIPNDFFSAPNLPVRIYNAKSVYQEPIYKKGTKNWVRYLKRNLKSELGNKYLVIPTGKDFITATVVTQFVLDKNGKIVFVKAKNAEFVHPKLAEEAIRVISKSPEWKPSIFKGNNIPHLYRQNITFYVGR